MLISISTSFTSFIIVFLLALFVGLIIAVRFSLSRSEEEIEREEKEQLLLVAASSQWYRNVVSLNQSTEYHTDILNNGHTTYYYPVKSKAAYDRMQIENALEAFLTERKNEIEATLKKVSQNKEIRRKYQESINSLYVPVSEEKCKILEIEYDKFIELEQQLIRSAYLPIICNYKVTCTVIYRTPQNHKEYEKSMKYDEKSIRSVINKMDERAKYQQTESYRRKAERAKVTPSLRYDILRRDGFRCCLCKRSAQDGIELEVDHIIPISKGGETTYDNLQTLCRDCNRGKGAKM